MDISIVQLFLRQPEAAQQTWQRILTDYPDALITQYVPNVQVLARGQNSLWRVCRWLKKLDRTAWYPPLADIPAVDFLIHPLPTSPSAFCTENDLIVWQTWTRKEPIEQQASRLGLTWKLLSERYDLNNDRINDPIGLLNDHVWAFLSDRHTYRPLDGQSGTSLDTVRLSDAHSFDWPGVKITDRNNDGRPEITSISQDHTYAVEWNGQRFARQDKNDSINEIPVASEWWQWRLPAPSAISRAIEAMYRKRNPRQALSLLKNYTSDDPWEAGLARYLEALARDYLGDSARAQEAYRRVVQEYSGTGWSVQALEKLK
jgi:tetratricopeptide (TPR) repeat protein